MGLFRVFSRPQEVEGSQPNGEKQQTIDQVLSVQPNDIPLPLSPTVMNAESQDTSPVTKRKRLSLRTFSFVPHKHHKHGTEHKPALSTTSEQELKVEATVAVQKYRISRPVISRSEKRAKKAALVLRSLMVGPNQSPAVPNVSPADKPRLSKIKSYLMKPSSANKVIKQLRALPPTDGDGDGSAKPIHAICLEHPDAEEDKLHFARFHSSPSAGSTDALASVEALDNVITNMKVVNLISSPDLGLGQAGDGEGILAGAVPTPETVLNGIKRITPELMALGFATGKAIVPDHAGVYPPTDRMSVLTYWWGLEVLLPPPSLEFLSSVHSVSGAVVNFLSAFALVNQGAREVLPFIRYISQYIDFEFNAIKAKDKGLGVVCAATWIMPAAMVPRPWDFPIKPAEPTSEKEAPGKEASSTKPLLPVDEAMRKPLPPPPPVGKVPLDESKLPVLTPHTPPVLVTPTGVALA